MLHWLQPNLKTTIEAAALGKVASAEGTDVRLDSPQAKKRQSGTAAHM